MIQTKNGYVQIKPVKVGMLANEGNEFKVLATPIKYSQLPNNSDEVYPISDFEVGDIVIVEDAHIVRVYIDGTETFFIKEENILARICRDDFTSTNDNCQRRAKV